MIEVKNIVKTYKTCDSEFNALDGVSFTIEDGEFVAIMGPSGSGKSTLMHMLGALDSPTSGTYYLDGKDVSTLSDDELADIRRDKIGFVFQSFNLLPRTSVLENVKLPLLYAKDKTIDVTARATEVLDMVGLSHRLNYFTNQISGGEKQRVAIARALINKPSVIFADEPTGNLDSKSGTQVMKILQDLNEAGNTIILVTHETYTSEHAKRIISVRDGNIVKDELVTHRRFAKEGEILK